MATANCTPAEDSDTPSWLDTVASISLMMIVGGWDAVLRGVVVLVVVVAVSWWSRS